MMKTAAILVIVSTSTAATLPIGNEITRARIRGEHEQEEDRRKTLKRVAELAPVEGGQFLLVPRRLLA